MIKHVKRLAGSASASLVADGDRVVREAMKRVDAPTRRLFLQRGLTLGGLSMLTGCALDDSEAVGRMLTKISFLNDRVQGALFSGTTLAPRRLRAIRWRKNNGWLSSATATRWPNPIPAAAYSAPRISTTDAASP